VASWGSSSRFQSLRSSASCSSTSTSASTPKLALLSDIHSNLEALDAVLEALPAIDGVVVLGDIVGYGPDPNAVVARLRSIKARAVRGNHDQAMLTPQVLEWFNPDAAAAARWTASVLSASNRQYLGDLPTNGRIGPHRCVHGSPRKPYLWEYILEESQAIDILSRLGSRLCFFGHTHLPRVFTDKGEWVPSPLPETEWVALPARALVNPGSVGQPRDGHPDASCAVVDLDRHSIQFRRVPYDIPTTQAKIMAAGLPEVEATRLAYGR
jgi:diadenosine tetraphosphatase ApaH/serine/threonine PP2A family protein phosphatase